MYKIVITTKFNVINLQVEDIHEIDEVLEQPYIVSGEIEEVKERKLKK